MVRAVRSAIVVPVLVACAAEGKIHMGAQATESSAVSGATPSEPPPPKSEAAAPPPKAEPSPSPAPPVRGVLPGCSLQCVDANRLRLAKGAESSVASGVAAELDALHACTHGGPSPTLTLRFDSSGALTHFGVDDERSQTDDACVDSVRRRSPALTYPGPATLRCAERCKR